MKRRRDWSGRSSEKKLTQRKEDNRVTCKQVFPSPLSSKPLVELPSTVVITEFGNGSWAMMGGLMKSSRNSPKLLKNTEWGLGEQRMDIVSPKPKIRQFQNEMRRKLLCSLAIQDPSRLQNQSQSCVREDTSMEL